MKVLKMLTADTPQQWRDEAVQNLHPLNAKFVKYVNRHLFDHSERNALECQLNDSNNMLFPKVNKIGVHIGTE